MKLKIVTPKKIFFNGEVSLITVPGIVGPFTILEHHAPIISLLVKGVISFKNKDKNEISKLFIEDGLVEVSNNNVIICVELLDENEKKS